MFANVLATVLLSLAIFASAAPLPFRVSAPRDGIDPTEDPHTPPRPFQDGTIDLGPVLPITLSGLGPFEHPRTGITVRPGDKSLPDVTHSETFARRFNLSDIFPDLEGGASLVGGIAGILGGHHRHHLREDNVEHQIDIPQTDYNENDLRSLTGRIGGVRFLGEGLPKIGIPKDLQLRGLNESDPASAVKHAGKPFKAEGDSTVGDVLEEIGDFLLRRADQQARHVNAFDAVGAIENGAGAHGADKSLDELLHPIDLFPVNKHLRDDLVQELQESGEAAVVKPPAGTARLAGELQTLPHIGNMLRRAADGDEEAVTNIVRALVATHLQALRRDNVEAGEPQLL